MTSIIEVHDDSPLDLPSFIQFAHINPVYLDSIVESALAECTPEQLATIADAFVVPEAGVETQDGGSPIDVVPALYDFMAMADSVHDFSRRYLDVNDIVHKWCPAPMLQVFSPVYGQESQGRRKRAIEPMEIKREDILVKHLTRPKHLKFQGHAPIPNPFYKKSVMKRYPYDATKEIDQQARYARQGIRVGSKVISMEVWLKGNKPCWLELEQISRVCSTIQAVLGNNVEWIVDASHEALASIVTSFPIIRENLMKRFKVIGDLQHLRSKTASLVWTPIICDATLYDAGDLDRYVYESSHRTIGFDPNPTGKVYHEGYSYQVTLQGARHLANNDFSYRVAEEGTLHYSEEAHSLASMGKDIKKTLRLLNDGLISEEVAHEEVAKALSYKRAGDWGQVENCVLRGRAFITCDKLAAMYAILRGVPVVYLARAQHNDVLQMTFSLVR